MHSQSLRAPHAARTASRPGSYDELAERITERFPTAAAASCSALRGSRSTRPKTLRSAPLLNWRSRSACSLPRWCDLPLLSTATGLPSCGSCFRTQLRARTLTYRERIERLQSRTPKATSPGDVFRAQAAQAIDELQSFQHAIDDRLLAQAVELIATASQINLLAASRSFPVAAYLAYALNQLEVRTQLLDNVGGMNREFAAASTPTKSSSPSAFATTPTRSSTSPTAAASAAPP